MRIQTDSRSGSYRVCVCVCVCESVCKCVNIHSTSIYLLTSAKVQILTHKVGMTCYENYENLWELSDYENHETTL